MTARILWLNAALMLLLGFAAFELRRRWLEAEEKRKAMLVAKPAPTTAASPVANAPMPVTQAFTAAQYFEVAEKFLFSKDRNPTVVVEEKAPPPPPKPMPPLPNVFGVMDLGAGPTVFMSIGNAAQQGYRVGDKIGDFQLTAASPKEVTFVWEEKTITSSLDELVARSRSAAPPQEARAAAPVRPGMPDFTPAAPIKPPDNVKPAPGTDIGGDRRGCLPGDTSPSGTIVDGYRKVSTQYAFGPICYWEKAR